MRAVATRNSPSILSHAFEGKQCRTALNTETNMPYVCLPDLLQAMGTKTQTKDVLPEVKETFGDEGVTVLPILDALGRIQETTFISESAAAFIVSRGRTKVSQRLNRWLFLEVIPAIRKTGGYILGEENMDENQLVARTVLELNRKLEEQSWQLADQELKVEAYDQVMSTHTMFSLRSTARILGHRESQLLAWLQNHGYLTKEKFSHLDKRTMKKSRRYKYTPYAKYREAGLFAVKLQRSPNNTWFWDQTYITAKGLDYFRLLYGSGENMAA